MPNRNVIVEKDVRVPMRDGTILRADVYRPTDSLEIDAAVPGVVTRTPYDKELSGGGLVTVMPNALKLAERGYAVVVCDTRGRYASEGEFSPFHQEGPDGYDTLEWTAAQPWCDGKTAIYGPSYVGATTMLAAREAPPSLRCAVPIITADDYYDGWTYQGGAFQLGFAGLWGAGLAATSYLQQGHARPTDSLPALQRGLLGDSFRYLGHRPLADLPGVSEPGVAPWWGEWVGHDSRDGFWEAIRHSADYSRFQAPMLHIGGWFDIFGIGTVRNYRGLSVAGNAAQHLIIGPWAHTHYDRRLGELDFGAVGAAVGANVIGDINRFLDQHLKGRGAKMAGVRWFLMGANEWRESLAWPPPEAEPRTFYLGSHGAATMHYGDGRLDDECPAEDQRWDSYMYVAYRPVQTEGGSILQVAIGLPGPRDQSRAESRDDVLCYSTPPLERPLDVAGPVTVELFVSSDRPDTDFTAKLVDVHPDGKPISLTDGIIRARFREGFEREVLLEPGKTARVEIDLASIGHRFETGHRIRLEVSSSNYPRFFPNPNTAEPANTYIEALPAINTIHRGGSTPSALHLHALPNA